MKNIFFDDDVALTISQATIGIRIIQIVAMIDNDMINNSCCTNDIMDADSKTSRNRRDGDNINKLKKSRFLLLHNSACL